jgi:hypothetical protein
VHRLSLPKVVFCFTLVALVLSPSTLSARALPPPYVPAVVAGQFAQYKVLKDSCQSSIPGLCQQFETSLNDTTYAAVQVVEVSGPAITLELISIYKNGTGAHQGAVVNVATGTSNVTAFTLSTSDYFVLAGNLQAPEQLWNTPAAPTFNTTSNTVVLGEMRTVNHLNISMSSSYYGSVYSVSQVSEFDKSSGFLVDINFSVSSTGSFATKFDFEIGMVDNNVWRTSYIPDFDLSADPTSVSVVGNASATSTVTLHRLHGFSATVNLSATTSANDVSCSLSAHSLPMGGPDTSTLSCTGSAGTYTIIVEGNGGYSVHNASITVTVSAIPLFAQLIGVLSMPLVYGGIGVAAVVTALASFLFLRRKPRAAVVAPGVTSTPTTQA